MLEVHLQPLLPEGKSGPVGNVIAAHFPYTIGRRRECDLRVSDACVSREHCRLLERGGRVWVKDSGVAERDVRE